MFKLRNKEVSIEALSKIENFQKLVLEFVNKYGLLGNFRFLLESYEFMDNGELPANLGYNTSINALDFENMKAVNTTLINLYWGIGKEIYNQQQEKGWGKSIVEVLSKEIQKEFPEVKGFSASNLWRMRNFYLTYKDIENLAPLVREISWTKNIVITEKCKDNLEREFYIKMTKKYGWSKDVLINHIENKSYEKYLINQTNFDETLPEKYVNQAKLAVKDEYIFDIMELSEQHSERELERALVDNIKDFLGEMGGNFAFMGNQYHLNVDGNDFYIDLLLYHRSLKSLVAIELKIGEFKPEYVGQLQFYLTVLDKQVKMESENPSIGIIICKEKNRTVVEYALSNSDKPIGVATYKIHDSLPEQMKDLLPSPEEIKKRLEGLDNEN